MTTFTWEDVLSAIREGKQAIPTATNGVPLVAVNAPFYELMQLMEALTAGYNALVLRDAENQKKIEHIRKLAESHFPATRKATDWISVDDSLPQKSGKYFAYDPSDGVSLVYYSAKHKMWNVHDYNIPEDAAKYAIASITHWLPCSVAPAIHRKEDD